MIQDFGNMKIYSPKIVVNILLLFYSAIIPIHAIISKRLFFQANDDVGLMMMLNGTYYVQATAHTIHISYPLGWVIKSFNSYFPTVAWYVVFMFVTQFLAVFLFLKLVVDHSKTLDKFRNILVNIFSLFVPILFFTFFYSIQFTQTAIMASAVGTLGLISSKDKFSQIIGGALVFIGLLWRPEGGAIAIVVALLMYTLFTVKSKKMLKTLFQKPTTKTLFLIFFIGYLVYPLMFSSWSPLISEERQDFASLFKARYAIQHFQPTPDAVDQIWQSSRQQGWQRNDFNLFIENYYYADTKVYSTETLKKIAESRIQQPKHIFYYQAFILFNKNLAELYLSILIVSTILVGSIFVILRISFLLSLFYLFSSYIVFFGIFTQGRLPERVFVPTVFVLVVSAIIGALVSVKDSQKEDPQNQYFNVLSLLGLILTFSTTFQYVDQRNNEISEIQWWKIAEENQILGFDQLLSFKSDKPIIVMPSFYPYLSQTVSPLDTASDLSAIWRKVLPLGWANRSPEYQRKVQKLGLNEDLFSSLASGDAYLATTEPKDFKKIEKYLARHQGIQIEWDPTPVFLAESGLAIWQADLTTENE